MREARQFISGMANEKGWMDAAKNLFNAQRNKQALDDFKAQILELAPLLHVGLTAQHLMDRERDRKDAEADHRQLMKQQERLFREMQAARLVLPRLCRHSHATFLC